MPQADRRPSWQAAWTGLGYGVGLAVRAIQGALRPPCRELTAYAAGGVARGLRSTASHAMALGAVVDLRGLQIAGGHRAAGWG